MVSTQLPSACCWSTRNARPRAIIERSPYPGPSQCNQGQRRVEDLGSEDDERPPAPVVGLALPEQRKALLLERFDRGAVVEAVAVASSMTEASVTV